MREIGKALPRHALHPASFAVLGVFATAALVAVLALSGCGSDTAGPGKNSLSESFPSRFQGFFASEGLVGRMSMEINASARSLAPAPNVTGVAVSATASLWLEDGGNLGLAGTYDSASDSIRLAGAGYDFEGRVGWVNGQPTVAGTYTSPGDDGAFAVALINTFGPHQYCGRLYMASDSTVGRLAYVVTGTAILGAACFSNEPDPVLLQGEVDTTSPKPRLSLSGSSAARDLILHGAYDEEAELSAGSWTSTGSAGDASGTWSVASCP